MLPSTFYIELLSSKDLENVVVYGVRGKQLKLVNLEEKILTEMSKIFSTAEYLYFSNEEE